MFGKKNAQRKKKAKQQSLFYTFGGGLSSSGSIVFLVSLSLDIRFFPVFTKKRTDIWGSELYWAFVSLSLAFLEVKFLGQRFWIPIAKLLSGNVLPASAPPSLGWEGTPWAALSVVWKVFHNSWEGGADVLSLFYLHFFDCYRGWTF